MNIYVCTDHEGHLSVGVCSVVVAASKEEARGLLKAELHEHRLNENKPFTLRLLNTSQPKAFVLLDGDY